MEVDEKPQDVKKQCLTPLQAAVALCKRGHHEMLPRLRELLKAEPAVWQYVGDLARQVERSWIELIGGKDDLLKESVALFVEKLRDDLAGPHATTLERLMAERVVACWLQWTYTDGLEVQNPGMEGTRVATFHAKRQAEAHRRFIARRPPWRTSSGSCPARSRSRWSRGRWPRRPCRPSSRAWSTATCPIKGPGRASSRATGRPRRSTGSTAP